MMAPLSVLEPQTILFWIGGVEHAGDDAQSALWVFHFIWMELKAFRFHLDGTFNACYSSIWMEHKVLIWFPFGRKVTRSIYTLHLDGTLPFVIVSYRRNSTQPLSKAVLPNVVSSNTYTCFIESVVLLLLLSFSVFHFVQLAVALT